MRPWGASCRYRLRPREPAELGWLRHRRWCRCHCQKGRGAGSQYTGATHGYPECRPVFCPAGSSGGGYLCDYVCDEWLSKIRNYWCVVKSDATEMSEIASKRLNLGESFWILFFFVSITKMEVVAKDRPVLPFSGLSFLRGAFLIPPAPLVAADWNNGIVEIVALWV